MATEFVNESSFSRLMGMTLVAREDGRAAVALTVDDRHLNTVGVAHGGILTSLMDTACGAAVSYQPSIDGMPVMTVSLQASYLGAGFPGDTLTATAARRGRGRRVITCQVEVHNQRGEIVGVGLGTFRVRSQRGALRRS